MRSPTPASVRRSTVPCSRTPARTRASTYSRVRFSTITDSMPCRASSWASVRPAGPAPMIPTWVRMAPSNPLVTAGSARGRDVLEDDGQPLPHADADRRHAPAVTALAQHLRQRAEDPAAGGAERVPDRDRAALRVDDVRVDLPRVDTGERLDGERLVQLDGADVRPGDPGPPQRAPGGLDRGVPEVQRLQREGRPPGDPGHRIDPQP